MEWIYGDKKIINSYLRDNILIDSMIYLPPTREWDLIFRPYHQELINN